MTEEVQNAAAPVTEPVAVTAPEAKPAPAAEPTATPAPTPAATQDGQEFTYEPTGYPNADYALGVIGKAGIGPEHPAVVAAYDGDFGQLQHLLASKQIAGADALLSMLKDASDQHAAKTKEEGERIANDVYELAGGKEQWEAVQQWAAQNADDEEKEILNDMFKDSRTHKIAATYLMSMYDKAQVPHEPAARVDGGRPPVAGVATAAATPLDRKGFADAARELYKKFGDSYTTTPEYQALAKRLAR